MRSLYKTLTNQSLKKPSAVRWFVWFEMAKQIHYTFPSVEAIINHEDDFCPETRNKLRFILEEYYTDLRLEIALIIDIGTDLVKLCYQQEGDGFLAPTSFDHWASVANKLSNISDEDQPVGDKLMFMPITDVLLMELIINVAEREEKFKELTRKIIPLHQKMVYDSDGRMYETLCILRACRLLCSMHCCSYSTFLCSL